MPIQVQALNADGLEVGSASDPGLLDKVVEDAEDYVLLGQVDRYATVVFGRGQMADFLADWEILSGWAHSRADQQFALDVEQLALRVQDGIGLSLRFVGD